MISRAISPASSRTIAFLRARVWSVQRTPLLFPRCCSLFSTEVNRIDGTLEKEMMNMWKNQAQNQNDEISATTQESMNLEKQQALTSSSSYLGDTPRTSVLMELTDRMGVLHDILRFFWKHDVNITRIESRPVQQKQDEAARFDFFVDFDGKRGDDNVEKLLQDLRRNTDKLLILDEKEVRA